MVALEVENLGEKQEINCIFFILYLIKHPSQSKHLDCKAHLRVDIDIAGGGSIGGRFPKDFQQEGEQDHHVKEHCDRHDYQRGVKDSHVFAPVIIKNIVDISKHVVLCNLACHHVEKQHYPSVVHNLFVLHHLV